ncbi:MAG: AAA family ATPase, partial [Nitrososphaerota archaeon]|nr:AAA family ATPase [Nitrososphaerota archaeon]
GEAASPSQWGGPDFDLFAIAYDERSRAIKNKGEARRVRIPSMAILPPLSLPENREVTLTEETTRRGLGTDLSSRHFRNEIQRYRSSYYAEFKNLSERTWPELQIKDFKKIVEDDETQLNLIVRDGPFVAELAWMGSGVKMWLQIMWFLARAKSSEIVVLDEPDIYLHPDLQRKLALIARSLKGQTILTTHSVEYLAEVDPEDVLIVNKRKERSRFANSLVVVQEAVDRMGTGQNIQLMRLWTSKRFLLVEGKDAHILSKFHSKLFPNAHTPFGAFPCQSIGGWGGWQRAIGSASTLKNAAGERIMTYCILDRDYFSEDVVKEREKEAKDFGIELHIWRRKEIENYFLCPTAIMKVINDGLSSKDSKLEVEDVSSQMDAIEEQMKDHTIDTFAEHYFQADKAAGLGKAMAHARERVNEAWKTRDGRLSILSGKDMLSNISKWSQKTYGVSIGLATIAHFMSNSDIESEIRSVISAIERVEHFTV